MTTDGKRHSHINTVEVRHWDEDKILLVFLNLCLFDWKNRNNIQVLKTIFANKSPKKNQKLFIFIINLILTIMYVLRHLFAKMRHQVEIFYYYLRM